MYGGFDGFGDRIRKEIEVRHKGNKHKSSLELCSQTIFRKRKERIVRRSVKRTRSSKKRKYTIEHILPREHFANLEDDYYNLSFCCDTCNGKKSDKQLDKSGLILRKQPRAPRYNSSLGFSKYLYGTSHNAWKYYLPDEGEAITW